MRRFFNKLPVFYSFVLSSGSKRERERVEIRCSERAWAGNVEKPAIGKSNLQLISGKNRGELE